MPVKHLAVLLLTMTLLTGQSLSTHTLADPFYLSAMEYSAFDSLDGNLNTDIRPFHWSSNNADIQFQASTLSRLYYNDNVPNLENTAEIWVGKGSTVFNSVRLSLDHQNFYVSLEPYYQYSQNKTFVSHHVVRDTTVYNPKIVWKYNVLNDGPGRGEDSVNKLRLRGAQIYGKYKGWGIGISNAGMWWGPGIHNTLNMTTNTTGFPHVDVGTIEEFRYKSLGMQARYIFGELNKNPTRPYLTAILGSLSFYRSQVISLGFIRTFLSGGTNNQEVSARTAALLPFQAFFKENLYKDDGIYDFGNVDDQTASLFVTFLFPEIKLKMFLEYGWNDHRWDWYDLRAHPDHSGASVIGFRKYGLLDFQELIFGFEYANLARSQFFLQRQTPDWYGRKAFFYSTNDGRRFAAHSGSDSDDMLIYVGWIGKDWYMNVAFNYERHGIIYSAQLVDDTNAFHFPENKLEIQLDYRRKLWNGDLYIYYEYEFTENLGSPAQLISPHVDRPVRKANVWGIGFESQLFSWKSSN